MTFDVDRFLQDLSGDLSEASYDARQRFEEVRAIFDRVLSGFQDVEESVVRTYLPDYTAGTPEDSNVSMMLESTREKTYGFGLSFAASSALADPHFPDGFIDEYTKIADEFKAGREIDSDMAAEIKAFEETPRRDLGLTLPRGVSHLQNQFGGILAARISRDLNAYRGQSPGFSMVHD